MDCQELEKSLRGFLSGELSSEDTTIVRLHLARCHDCRTRLSALDRIEILPALDETVEPSPDMRARFHARLIRRRSQSSTVLRRWPGAGRIYGGRLAAAALAAAIVVSAVLVGSWLRTPQDAEVTGRDLAVAENLPLLRNMDVISNLEILENFEEIQEMAQNSDAGH